MSTLILLISEKYGKQPKYSDNLSDIKYDVIVKRGDTGTGFFLNIR